MTLSTPISFLAALALTACTQSAGSDKQDDPVPMPSPATAEPAPAPQPPPPASSIPPPPVALPVISIRGGWTLEAIDGAPVPPASRMVLNIGPDRIDFSNCQQVNWGYSLDDGNLALRRIPAITIDINPKPQPCAARFPPPIAEMVRRFDAARRVDRAGEVRVRITGDAGRVTLAPAPGPSP